MLQLNKFKMSLQLHIIIAASIAHEVNRAFCESIGDTSQPTWENAPQWQKNSAIAGVCNWIDMMELHGFIRPQDSHESWLEQKSIDGWVYGPEKNEELKTHPCIMPYEDLPAEQKAKDRLFLAAVGSYMKINYYGMPV